MWFAEGSCYSQRPCHNSNQYLVLPAVLELVLGHTQVCNELLYMHYLHLCAILLFSCKHAAPAQQSNMRSLL